MSSGDLLALEQSTETVEIGITGTYAIFGFEDS